MRSKSVSSGTKNPAKYFKWSLEKRLLLIETVTKVDEEQKAILHTVGKVVDGGSDCGITPTPAVATVPLTTTEKWQEVASRMPPEVFHDIDRAKLESTCRSQFVKLHQRLQFMKRDSHDRYRRHGKPDAIMTDEICQKIATYRATYLRRRKDLAVQPKKNARGRPPLRKGRGEQVSVSTAAGRHRKLARGRPVHGGHGEDAPGSSEKLQQRTLRPRKLARGRPVHEGHGEDAPGSSEKLQQRTLRPRKLARGLHPLWKSSGQLSALVRKLARGRRPLQKGVESEDELCTMRPQKRAEPSQVVSQGCGHPPLPEKYGSEGKSERNVDKQLCTEDHEEPDEEHAPVTGGPPPLDDQRGELDREHAPVSDDEQHYTEDPGGELPLEMSLDDKLQCTSEGSGEPGGQQAAPVSDDNQLCTRKLSAKLDGSQVAALACAQQKPQSPQRLLDKREALETKLCKDSSFPRSGMFRWSEAARLQVIHGVKMMNNLTEAGQIRSWREVAERLPMRLFWDIDLDRLATIAKKQFSEMRRRYRIMKDNELAGVAVKFNILTKKVLHELEEYEESCLRRTPQTPSLCGSSHDRRWVTKRPHQAHSGEFSNAEGTVLVESFSCFSSSENSMESDSSRSIYRGFDSFTGDHQRSISRAHDMESSDFKGKASFQSYSNSEASRNSESSYREFIQNEDHYAKFSNGNRRETSKFSSYDREADFDLPSRQTVSSFEDDRHSEPQHKSESLLRRRRRCSSYRSYNSLEDNMTSNRKNQLNRRFQNCERQRRVKSYLSDDSGQNHSNRLREVQIDYRAQKEQYSRDRRCSESDDPNDYGVRNQARNQEGRQYGQSSAQYSDSVSEESLRDSRHHSEEQDHNRFAHDESGSHSNDDNPDHNCDDGTQGSDDQSESLHRGGDQGGYDSAYSTDNDSRSRLSDSDPEEAHDKCNKSNNQNSEGEARGDDFVQSESGEDPQRDKRHGKRQESIQWKRSSSAHSRDERASQGHETSPSNHRHWEHDYSHNHQAHPPSKRARANGEFKHCESALALTLTKGTDTSEPEQDEMSKEPRAPVLDETLEDLDLEYSKLDWWMKHQLFPMEREKIANAIKSAEDPRALEKRQRLGSDVEGKFDKVVDKCRRKRIRLVIKAEFQQVRLKLVQEIERSSQVVVEEILDSFRP